MSRADVKALRSDVAERIRDAATAAGSRVYVERIRRFTDAELTAGPAVCVYVPRETHEPAGECGWYQSRASVRVEVLATGADEESARETVDDLLSELEKALLSGDLRSAYEDVENISTETEPGQLVDGKALVVSAVLAFTVVYKTDFSLSPDDLDDLDTVTIEHENDDGDVVVMTQTVELAP